MKEEAGLARLARDTVSDSMRLVKLEIRLAIKDARDGGAPMSSQIARRVVLSFHGPVQDDTDVKLTEREDEILTYLSKGFANKEIADKMNISVPTVRTHLRHIYEKLHVRSRTEAIVKYLT